MKTVFCVLVMLAIIHHGVHSVLLNLQPSVVEEGSNLTLTCTTVNKQVWTSTWYREGNIALVLGRMSGNPCKSDWRIAFNETETTCFGNLGIFRLIIQHITTEQNNTKWQCDTDGDRSATKMIKMTEKTTVTLQVVPKVVNIGSKVEIICESSKSAWMTAWYLNGTKAVSVRRPSGNKCSLEVHTTELGVTTVICSPNAEQFNLTIHVVPQSLNNSLWDCRINDKTVSPTKTIVIPSYKGESTTEVTAFVPITSEISELSTMRSETSRTDRTQGSEPTTSNFLIPVSVSVGCGVILVIVIIFLVCRKRRQHIYIDNDTSFRSKDGRNKDDNRSRNSRQSFVMQENELYDSTSPDVGETNTQPDGLYADVNNENSGDGRPLNSRQSLVMQENELYDSTSPDVGETNTQPDGLYADVNNENSGDGRPLNSRQSLVMQENELYISDAGPSDVQSDGLYTVVNKQ